MSFTSRLVIILRDNINIGIFLKLLCREILRSSARNPIGPSLFSIQVLGFFTGLPLEQQDGSSGNALVGMDFRALFLKRFSLYGSISIG